MKFEMESMYKNKYGILWIYRKVNYLEGINDSWRERLVLMEMSGPSMLDYDEGISQR